MAVADVTDLPNWYCNQWRYTYGSQKSNRFVFSANFTKTAVKCKQTAEKPKLFDICVPYGWDHWFQYEFGKSVTSATAILCIVLIFTEC